MEIKYCCGVDEAGRGPLAGKVYAAAVILDPQRTILGLKDSKQLTSKRREELYLEITEKALAYGIAFASVSEIEQLNILQASLLAMQRAVEKLKIKPQLVLVDGNCVPKLDIATQAIINGDKLKPEIAAASILAKVTRDREMIELDNLYPEYGFAKHKGYATKEHLAMLKKYGVLDIHRKTFAPVSALCL